MTDAGDIIMWSMEKLNFDGWCSEGEKIRWGREPESFSDRPVWRDGDDVFILPFEWTIAENHFGFETFSKDYEIRIVVYYEDSWVLEFIPLGMRFVFNTAPEAFKYAIVLSEEKELELR